LVFTCVRDLPLVKKEKLMRVALIALAVALLATPATACDENSYRETIRDLERQIATLRKLERRQGDRIKDLEKDHRKDLEDLRARS
jgi:hypothetical protein